jgi:hypothetical protein
MAESYEFAPPRRWGLILHYMTALVLLMACGTVFWYTTQQAVGLTFVLLLLLSLALVAPMLASIYRAYSLLQASYLLERDGLRLRWGLRAEDIPLPDVEWVRPASDLQIRLPRPFLSFPGSLLGEVNVPGLGTVEYLASGSRTMLLVATRHKIYAISPADPLAFVTAFQRVIEMGSISPIKPVSTVPAAFLQAVWTNLAVRILWITSLVLLAVLFATVVLLIPARASISLGFTPGGLPVEPGPPELLLLLPVLGTLTFILDMLAGLYFYRHISQRPVAFLFWGANVVTPILLLAAVGFMA